MVRVGSLRVRIEVKETSKYFSNFAEWTCVQRIENAFFLFYIIECKSTLAFLFVCFSIRIEG